MEMNYPILGIVVLAVISLIIFLVCRNRKDEKKFEKEMTESETGPTKHDKDRA